VTIWTSGLAGRFVCASVTLLILLTLFRESSIRSKLSQALNPCMSGIKSLVSLVEAFSLSDFPQSVLAVLMVKPLAQV
jgi:hypothetical protein